MDIKRLFIDTETTGLDPKQHGLVQVAGIVDINGEVEEEFDFTLKPIDGKLFETRALEVNGLDMNVINGYKPSDTVFHLFRQLIKRYIDQYNPKDKFTFLAYNAPFDVGFIRQWFLDHNDKYYGSVFFRYPIDVASIAMEALIDKRHEMPNDKLETVMKYFDVSAEGKLHDARTDIIATREVYYKALKKIKGDGQTSLFGDEVEF